MDSLRKKTQDKDRNVALRPTIHSNPPQPEQEPINTATPKILSRTHQGHSAPLTRRLILLRVASIVLIPVFVMVLIGSVYARGTIMLVPRTETKSLSIDIQVSQKPGINSIHGSWLYNAEHDDLFAYSPVYIPLIQAKGSHYSILILKRDIIKYLEKRIEISTHQQIADVHFSDVDLDEYALLVPPSSVQVKARATVILESVIDKDLLAQNCSLKFISPFSQNFKKCLENQNTVARAQIEVHPWFALRSPVARAIEVNVR